MMDKMNKERLKNALNSVYGRSVIYADTDSVKYDRVELMREIIHVCITVQCEYSNLPLQDRVYIAFGRVVTAGCYGADDIEYIITTIKSEFEFLEGVWNGEKRKG